MSERLSKSTKGVILSLEKKYSYYLIYFLSELLDTALNQQMKGIVALFFPFNLRENSYVFIFYM